MNREYQKYRCWFLFSQSLFSLLFITTLSIGNVFAQEKQDNPSHGSEAFYFTGGVGFGGLGLGYQFEVSVHNHLGLFSIRLLNFEEIQLFGDPGGNLGDFALMYGTRSKKQHQWASLSGGFGLSHLTRRECTKYSEGSGWFSGDCIQSTSNTKWGMGLAFDGTVGLRFVSISLVGDLNKVKPFWGVLLNLNLGKGL